MALRLSSEGSDPSKPSSKASYGEVVQTPSHQSKHPDFHFPSKDGFRNDKVHGTGRSSQISKTLFVFVTGSTSQYRAAILVVELSFLEFQAFELRSNASVPSFCCHFHPLLAKMVIGNDSVLVRPLRRSSCEATEADTRH
jgi:hypothetical protein